MEPQQNFECIFIYLQNSVQHSASQPDYYKLCKQLTSFFTSQLTFFCFIFFKYDWTLRGSETIKYTQSVKLLWHGIVSFGYKTFYDSTYDSICFDVCPSMFVLPFCFSSFVLIPYLMSPNHVNSQLEEVITINTW